MKKFKYRLESYLKYLGQQRDFATAEKNRAEAYLSSLILQKQGMQQQVIKSFARNTKTHIQGDEVHMAQDNNLFIQRLKVEIENVSEEIRHAEKEFSEKQTALFELQKRVKSLEKHKDMEKEKHKKFLSKTEQKKLDEMNHLRRSLHHAKSS